MSPRVVSEDMLQVNGWVCLIYVSSLPPLVSFRRNLPHARFVSLVICFFLTLGRREGAPQFIGVGGCIFNKKERFLRRILEEDHERGVTDC